MSTPTPPRTPIPAHDRRSPAFLPLIALAVLGGLAVPFLGVMTVIGLVSGDGASVGTRTTSSASGGPATTCPDGTNLNVSTGQCTEVAGENPASHRDEDDCAAMLRSGTGTNGRLPEPCQRLDAGRLEQLVAEAKVEAARTPPPAPTAAAKSAPAPAAPEMTTAQREAIESAESYLALSGFSKAGLLKQLTSEYGDGFKVADAKYAVEHVEADWNAEAVEAGRSYLEMSGFSRAGLIKQLTSKYGDQFTKSQATYAADELGL